MWKYTGVKECNDFLLSLHLINVQNEKKYIKTLYAISNNVESNYKVYKIKKRNGKYRTIYEPNSILKQIQKSILKELYKKSVSKYAKAYRKGLGLKDNALTHVDKKIILKLDIENFFESISFMNVYNACFPIEYYPKSVGMLLTFLCTYDNHLTQGSPTSPYISNLVMKTFDEEIGLWCEKNNISYTRYSDDMTFSGDFNVQEVITIVKEKLTRLGLKLNKDKIHVVYNYASQNVTGIVVNDKAQVNPSYRKKIRQEVYYIKKFGIDSHLKTCHIKMDSKLYLNKLYGRILYVLQINENDNEFKKYKQYIGNLQKSI